ncbi:MAG TPA: ABC transporter permease [Terracidiphilus sp.]|jgi:predicted permease|nr:ABC transporter permease [Terracidiphilus sp.]
MKHVIQDLRYALRQIRRSPGFAITAVLTLALGIAANTTILSWISATLFDPIPGAAHTGDMASIMVGERTEHPTPPLSYPDFVDMRAGTKTISGIIAEHQDYISITGTAQPERIFGELTSADYFEVLGVEPYLGRTLISTLANERAGAPIAVLSYSLWQNRFGSDPGIIGKTIQLNRFPYTIVGVAPKGFHGAVIGLRSDIFLPLGMMQQVWGWNPIDRRGTSFLNVSARLRPGVDRRAAQNELNVKMQGIASRYPTDHQGNNTVSLDPLWRSPFGANVYLAGTLPILLALASVLLLLACANVANLLLVRSVARRREFAIRLSMGANRWRLVRQLLIEDLLVGLAGGGLALLATFWSARTLASFIPITSLPLAINGHVGRIVLFGTIAVSLLTALISGIVPAIRASQLAPVSVLKDESLSTSGGLSKSRLAAGLVIAQVALSLLLLACAGLFVRSLQAAQRINPGFDSTHVLLTTFDLDPLGYTAKAGAEFQRRVTQRVEQLPGVQSATLADFSPLSFTIHSEGVLPEGYVPHLHESMEVDRGVVGPEYLATMRTPLIGGREFTSQDTADAQRVAMVNQAFVDRYWPGQNAIGKQINDGRNSWTVVGVTANGKYRRLVYDPAPLVLYPLAQRYENEVILHVRTQGDPQTAAFAVQQAIHQLNANLPLYNVTTLRENIRMGSVFERLAVTFAGSFGLLALLLAAIGLYGVVSYTARQRTHEIGIRMALGAGKADIFGHVLGQGLRLTLMGLGAGLIAALFLTRFMRNLVFGVGTSDWLTFATVSVVLCAVALVACYLPARRAASVDPMQALRTE